MSFALFGFDVVNCLVFKVMRLIIGSFDFWYTFSTEMSAKQRSFFKKLYGPICVCSLLNVTDVYSYLIKFLTTEFLC